MDAQTIMNKMAEKYASCNHYLDAGTVSQWEHGSKKRNRIRFDTYFSRPSLFRFEWVDQDELNIIWANGVQVRSRYSYEDDTEVYESLSLAVAGATGVSMGSAFVVPSLLLDEVRQNANHLLLLKDMELLTDESTDDCICIVGSESRERDTTLWISAMDYSLRGIREETIMSASEVRGMMEETAAMLNQPFDEKEVHKDMHHWTEMRYDKICFNEPIDRKVFSYEPDRE